MGQFQVGDKVRFTSTHAAILRKSYGRKPAPAWLYKTGTVAKVEAEGWLVTITMNDESGSMGVNPTCLERV